MAIVAAAAPVYAQEVDAGQWINLFDGETLFGWVNTSADADWQVQDGAITNATGSGGALMTTSQFKDFELQLKVKVSRPGYVGIAVRSPLEGNASENGAGVIQLGGEEGEAAWQEVRVVARGGELTASVDEKKVEDFSASNALGHIGILYQKYHGLKGQAKVEVSDVKLRPLNLNPIFNGENLDGWNILPGHKSEFKVVDGAINILDGNGQIETDAVWKNFLLQMEIISNGEHLNSGVFFRGPKGVFWKGYESQVRNQWQGEDRTKPVDFGTGGLYGVQPARKVVSTDGEWFTKTVIANGNHFAVWINGHQVSDLYDTRPASDNGDGKNGYVPEAGTIHLQGHDPTTNLSFRSINLQQYPSE
jgi:hypothetical protein